MLLLTNTTQHSMLQLKKKAQEFLFKNRKYVFFLIFFSI